jgi:phosphopantetheinyl transferase
VPLFYQHDINLTTKLAIWKIEEAELFFSSVVSLQREITHPVKRLQHLAGRYLLSYLFPDFPFDEILIADTRKPYLPNEQYHFSISHCGHYAAAIVSSTERVGIDIEIPTDRVLKIVHKFLSEKERQYFTLQQHQLPNAGNILPTLLWSAKEAMFKWWGWGEVDFSEMLLIENFELINEGMTNAHFIRPPFNQSFHLYYKIMPDLCLTWLSTKENVT